jgi:hypothetical protein
VRQIFFINLVTITPISIALRHRRALGLTVSMGEFVVVIDMSLIDQFLISAPSSTSTSSNTTTPLDTWFTLGSVLLELLEVFPWGVTMKRWLWKWVAQIQLILRLVQLLHRILLLWGLLMMQHRGRIWCAHTYRRLILLGGRPTGAKLFLTTDCRISTRHLIRLEFRRRELFLLWLESWHRTSNYLLKLSSIRQWRLLHHLHIVLVWHEPFSLEHLVCGNNRHLWRLLLLHL